MSLFVCPQFLGDWCSCYTLNVISFLYRTVYYSLLVTIWAWLFVLQAEVCARISPKLKAQPQAYLLSVFVYVMANLSLAWLHAYLSCHCYYIYFVFILKLLWYYLVSFDCLSVISVANSCFLGIWAYQSPSIDSSELRKSRTILCGFKSPASFGHACTLYIFLGL